jgi:hypothetical protein
MRALLLLLCLLAPAAQAACVDPAEPSLRALEQAALRSAALEPTRVRSMLRRARVAALLPQLSVRVGRGAYDSLRDGDTLQPSSLSSDTFHWEVMAHLFLDRLVFDLHELRSAEAAGRLAEHRARLLEQVAELWQERQELAQADARCEALSSLLDALTGGALVAPLKSLPRAPPRR